MSITAEVNRNTNKVMKLAVVFIIVRFGIINLFFFLLIVQRCRDSSFCTLHHYFLMLHNTMVFKSIAFIVFSVLTLFIFFLQNDMVKSLTND